MSVSSQSSCRASDGHTVDGDSTQLYRDTEILDGLGRTDMAHLNRRQVHTHTHSCIETLRYWMDLAGLTWLTLTDDR